MLLAVQRAGEPVPVPDGISGYDVSYATPSLFDAHANIATITSHIHYGEEDRWSLLAMPEPALSHPSLAPTMHTVHLGPYVFKEFGLDAAPFDPLGEELKTLGPTI